MSHLQVSSPQYSLNTAVLFLIFNRPETTKKVFEAIRLAEPPRLYVAADGPREDRATEADSVKAVRDFVVNEVDWDCEVKTLFREKNLGCKYAVSSAIQWFFENETQGIILEDDTLPNPDFFYAMESGLEKYKANKSIACVCGRNELAGTENFGNEPFLTDKFWCWGWASWSDRILGLDVEFGYRKSDDVAALSNSLFDSLYLRYLSTILKSGEVNTWDWPFDLGLRKEGMKSLVFPKNLVVNIGFGPDGTHTTIAQDDNVPSEKLDNGLFLPDFPRYEELFVKKFMLKKMAGSKVKLAIVLLANFSTDTRYIFRLVNRLRRRVFG